MIATTEPPIEQIVRTIVDAVHPRRVVLFGSRARGDARPDSDVDLMVELDAELEPHALAGLFMGEPWTVDIKPVSAQRLALLRDDPGSTLYDVVREGRVLYRRDGVPRTMVGRVRERPRVPPTLAAWLAKAAEDMEVVELLVQAQKVPWGPVCFHAQQAAEKYLKAVLIQAWRRPPRSHDLVALLRACRRVGLEMPGLDDDCALLSKFAVTPRYPGDPANPVSSPTPLEGQAAVVACRRIVERCGRLLSSPSQ